MLSILIPGIIILFIAILLMGVRVFFTKDGKFPSLHIGDSIAMQETSSSPNRRPKEKNMSPL